MDSCLHTYCQYSAREITSTATRMLIRFIKEMMSAEREFTAPRSLC